MREGGAPRQGSRYCRMSDDEGVPAETEREHPLFVVAVWGTIVLVIVTIVTLACVLYTGPVKPPPAPAPWSCASVLAQIAPVDGGGQIAPVCGQNPYPDAP